MSVETPPLLLLAPSAAAIAQRWAAALGIAVQSVDNRRRVLEELALRHSAALVADEQGLALQALEKPLPGAVRVDFVQGALRWRQEHGGGLGEWVAKACGVKKDFQPVVVDATAGLGRDAFILASLGCQVQLWERSPIIAALLQDGLERATQNPDVKEIIGRMQFNQGDVRIFLQQALQENTALPDVIYLDPMFPHREKSALVKKEMRVFRTVVGEDNDADDLLLMALEKAKRRVVVKRPRLAPVLAGKKPSLVLEGKSGRFDIYLKPA